MTEGRPSRRERRPPEGPRFASGFSTLRDLLLFVTGLVIIGNEVFVSALVDPTAVAVGVALTGAPLVLGADERKAPK